MCSQHAHLLKRLLCYPQVYMKLRPHVTEFLQSMAKNYEVCAHLLIISAVIEDEMSIYSDGFRDGVAFFH